MYRQRNSSSNSNSQRDHRGNYGKRRSSGGFGRSRGNSQRNSRRMSSFDPSMLIQQAVPEEVKPEYVSKNTFSDFAVNELLKGNISSRGYETPTPIQDQIIPQILDGRDVIGLASTGTGKTAAFLIPLIHDVYERENHKVLIMAPTRELAVQIQAEFKLFSQGMGLYSTLCIGGSSMGRQIDGLKRRPEFVIGTPGRLIDLERQRKLNFNTFSAIVLDEVDQMLDMGFINDMKYVISRLPAERHSLFFSATLADKMTDIVNSFLHNPVKVQIAKQRAAINVNQDIVKLKGQSKIDVLHDLLNTDGFDKVLVFGRTKHGLDKLSKVLYQRGVRVAAIHGNKSQNQRQRSLEMFKRNAVQVLLATDIASRGLDIDDVTHVINYDLPQTYQDYIHRIGRTGRANKTGIALSFVD